MASFRLLLISLCAILLPEVYGQGMAVRFAACREVKSLFTVKEVRVTPCPGGDGTRCPLKKGTSPTVSVTFIPDREVKNMTATVHGIIATIPTEFPLPNRHACVNSNLTCPLVAGREYTYSQSVPVLSSYPNLQLLIRWALDSKGDQDAETKTNVCFIIRANLVD